MVGSTPKQYPHQIDFAVPKDYDRATLRVRKTDRGVRLDWYKHLPDGSLDAEPAGSFEVPQALADSVGRAMNEVNQCHTARQSVLPLEDNGDG
jgi:hypothetical protein